MKINTRDLRLLARFEFLSLIRSPQGLLALSFLVVYAGWVISKLFSNADFINGLASGGLSEEETLVLAAAKWLAGIDSQVLNRIFVSHSPFMILLFVMVVFATPVLAMIAGLDQNASDIGSRGIRFLLVRTDRLSLLLGRLLGTFLFWSAAVALVGLVGTLVGLGLDTHHGAGVVILDGLWITLGLILVSIPFLAFMALCSVSTGSPLLAATMGLGSYLGVALIGGVGGWLVKEVKVVRYLFPAPLRYDLVLGTGGEAAIAVVALLLYGAAFALAAGFIIVKRDL